MTTQVRNPEAVNLQSPDFLRREEFYQDGARIWDALYGTHREGGGRINWAWHADGPNIWTADAGVATLAENFLGRGDYFATAVGGPYVNLNAVGYYSLADADWQEIDTASFLVWTWVRTDTLVSHHAIVSKYDVAVGGLQSYNLFWNAIAGVLEWAIVGLPGPARIMVQSSYAVAVDTWYFVAAYYRPSTLMRIFVGAATESTLTIDSNVVAIPANALDLAIGFLIGADYNVPPAVAYIWSGDIGIMGARAGVPDTAIDGHVSRLFHLTRALYQ